MKDKNLPDHIKEKSLDELTEMANNIIINLEKSKNLESSINDYQQLIKIKNLIDKKFQYSSKEIVQTSKEKIKNILKKNEK
tara:strand:+ start:2053 stop:2295 length:243 start_codon:yes stop_codon:yes gene_type:complete